MQNCIDIVIIYVHDFSWVVVEISRGKETQQWRWKEARPEPLTGEALKRKPDQQSCCIHFVMKRSRSSEGIQRLMFQTSWSGPICLPAISRNQLQSASSQNCHMSWSADCISACDNVTLQDLNWQMCWLLTRFYGYSFVDREASWTLINLTRLMS